MALPKSVQDERSSDDRRRAGRRKRYGLRAGLWTLSNRASVKGCGRNVLQNAGHAALVVGNAGAGYEGLQLCSSLWACPCCSARIRQGRAVEIERIGLAHLNAGRGLYFLTLTMPHDVTDGLADLLDTVMKAWQRVQQRKGYRELRKQYGLEFIRATEITYTGALDNGNGWHPHLHLLLFTETHLSDDQREDLLGKVTAWWEHAIATSKRPDGSLYRRPGTDATGVHRGVNLRDVSGKTGHSGDKALFAYLTKVQDSYGDSWNVGAEMMRGDLKSGRRALSRTPFDLAALAVGVYEDSDGVRQPAAPEKVALWHEYETATAGRKAMHLPKSLRLRYAVEEVADEDIPEAEGPTVVVATIDQPTLRVLTRKRWALAALLDYAELGDFQAVDDLLETARLEVVGVVPKDPRPRAASRGFLRDLAPVPTTIAEPFPAPSVAYLRKLLGS